MLFLFYTVACSGYGEDAITSYSWVFYKMSYHSIFLDSLLFILLVYAVYNGVGERDVGHHDVFTLQVFACLEENLGGRNDDVGTVFLQTTTRATT